jgi:hypothetical protein
MNDRYDQELLLGYVEGELAPEQRAAVEAMLENDPALRALLEDMAADRELLRQLPTRELPNDLAEHLMLGRERQMLLGDPDLPIPTESKQAQARRFRFHRLLAYSGIAAVLLVSAGIVFQTLTGPSLWEEMQRYAGLEESFNRRQRGVSDSRVAMDSPIATQTPAPVALDSVPPSDRMASAPTEPSATVEGAEADSSRIALGEAAEAERMERVGKGGLAMKSAARSGDGQVSPSVIVGRPTRTSSLAMNVATADHERTRRDVQQWAVSNNAVIVAQDVGPMTAGVEIHAKPDVPVRGLAGGEVTLRATAEPQQAQARQTRAEFAGGQPAPQEQIVLALESRQVPQLLAYLNREQSQKADLVPNPVAEGLNQYAQVGAVADAPAVGGEARASGTPQAGVGEESAGPQTQAVNGRAVYHYAPAPAAKLGQEAVQIAATQRANAATQPATDNLFAPQGRFTEGKEAEAQSIRSFDWAAVLQNQLPLVPTTTLSAATGDKLLLPVNIMSDPSLQQAPIEQAPVPPVSSPPDEP